MQVWSIPDYELVKELPSQNHWVRALVAYGKHLYSGSYEAVKVQHIPELQHVVSCTLHNLLCYNIYMFKNVSMLWYY